MTASSDDRLIVTFATGKRQYLTMAKALAISLDVQNCTIPRAIITDSNDPELKRLWPNQVPPVEGFKHWFTKFSALKATSANRILFIDSDCLAVQPLDPIFQAFAGHPFAVQGVYRSEVQWYGDMTAVIKRMNLGQIPVFSGGFLYYERGPETEKLFERILYWRDHYDELGLIKNGGHVVDEVCISIAMTETKIGTLFPDHSDFSVTPWGLMSSLKLDVLHGECSFLKGATDPKLRKPRIYHTAHATFDLKYWREVKKLIQLDREMMANRQSGGDRVSKYRKPMRLLTELWHKVNRL